MRLVKGLVIIGFGGHARAVADVALACGIESLLFVESTAREGENFMGHPVQRDWPSAAMENWACFPALGENYGRQKQIEAAESSGWPLFTLIAPSATVGQGSDIAPGCLVNHHAHVGPLAQIGKGCIVNTGAIVEHQCRLGSFVHLAVNATLAGKASIGDYGFVGAGATVIDNVEICSGVMVGGGSVVTKNIDVAGTYIGIPARRMEKD